MTALSTKWHSRIDYLLAFILICSPWLFYFRDDTIQTFIPMACGSFIIFYSLLTKYELGALKLMSTSLHFALDTITGLLVALSPWLFGFAETVYMPHLAMGLALLLLAFVTRKTEIGLPAIQRHVQAYSHYHFSAWLGHKE